LPPARPHTPPVAPEVKPPPPPPPRPEWMAEIDREAMRQLEAAAIARARAKEPTIVGPSLEQIKFELFLAGAQRAAEAAAGEAANAALYAGGSDKNRACGGAGARDCFAPGRGLTCPAARGWLHRRIKASCSTRPA
jgi:hypothetical protein